MAMKSRTFDELLNSEPAVLVTDKDGVVLNPHSYYILWSRLDSYPKLAEWICHLAEKNWVTTEHLRQLVVVTEHHFGWPHHYGA